MMAKNPHQDWSEQQIAALIETGVDPVDAQATINRILAALPEGGNPSTWIAPVPDSTVTQSDVDDARADWYAKDEIPSRFKRLLDAAEDVDNAD